MSTYLDLPLLTYRVRANGDGLLRYGKFNVTPATQADNDDWHASDYKVDETVDNVCFRGILRRTELKL